MKRRSCQNVSHDVQGIHVVKHRVSTLCNHSGVKWSGKGSGRSLRYPVGLPARTEVADWKALQLKQFETIINAGAFRHILAHPECRFGAR